MVFGEAVTHPGQLLKLQFKTGSHNPSCSVHELKTDSEVYYFYFIQRAELKMKKVFAIQ